MTMPSDNSPAPDAAHTPQQDEAEPTPRQPALWAHPLRWMFGYEGIPYLARPTFRLDYISQIFFSLGIAMMVPELTQLFVQDHMGGGKWLVALLMAEFAAGNFSGAFLSHWLQKRKRVPLVAGARYGVAVVLAGIALLPATRSMAAVYTVILAVPTFLCAVNLNTTISVRHANYPDWVRGRIYSRFHMTNLAIILAAIQLASGALDLWPWAYRVLYPAAAACMATSGWIFSHIRVRSEPAMLREHQARREPLAIFSGFKLFWRDPRYGRFMIVQMISGSMVLMTVSVWAIVFKSDLGYSYSKASLARTLVPFGVALCSAPIFGRLFDRIGMSYYRAAGAAMWAGGRLILYAGLVFSSFAMILVGFAVQGLGRSIGGFAFGIAHTRFAPPGQSQTYMGLHMTLQGLRGMTMPFLGVWLYWNTPLGPNVILWAGVVQMLAAVGFAVNGLVMRERGADDS
jgi:MFS family permease